MGNPTSSRRRSRWTSYTSRPRLWWSDIDWQEVQCRLTHGTPFTLHWTTQNTYDQIHNPIATLIQPSVHIKDWETPAILCQRQLFHCLTTQAPYGPRTTTPETRPSRRIHVGSLATRQPTVSTLAVPAPVPYQTTPRAITPLQPEPLMGLPDHFTQITPDHPSTRTRNTMLGNAWHFPSALWLLFLLLLFYLQDHPFQHHHYKRTYSKNVQHFGIPDTLGTTTQTDLIPAHATARLDQSPQMGPFHTETHFRPHQIGSQHMLGYQTDHTTTEHPPDPHQLYERSQA